MERNATPIAIIATLLIGVLSLKTIHFESPLEITFLDKILHTSAYCFLTLTWLFAQRNKKRVFIIVVLIFLYGVLIEIAQGFAPNRTKDIYDIFANSLGIIIATVLFKYIYKYLKNIFGYTN